MADLLIGARRIVPAAGSAMISPGYVLVRDGRVSEVGHGSPPRLPDVDVPTGLLAPGFVDVQVNGYFGTELGDVEAGGWRTVARRLPETGTTSFVPTFITAPVPELAAALRAAARLVAEAAGPPCARVLGVHLEGPFISPRRAGAHNTAWITEPSAAAVDEILTAGAGALAILTLAPELPGSLAAIAKLAEAGVVVSAGHSDATAAQVSAAADAGARMVTHLFNAQRPLHHREPGIAGQALADPRLVSGIIADFHHVAAQVCRIAFAAAPGRICLVTDAASCAGMPPGRYSLGGEPIELPGADGEPPVRADGTLAGSALRMDAAVANMVSAGVAVPDAVAAATRIPADLLGRPELGRIAPGARADLVWLGEDMRARRTWVAGEVSYDKPAERTVM